MMTKKEYIEMCAGEYDAIAALEPITDFYEREKKFAAVVLDLSRRLFESSISNTNTGDRRKKKRSARLEQ